MADTDLAAPRASASYSCRLRQGKLCLRIDMRNIPYARPYFGFADSVKGRRMGKLIDEFRRGWQGVSQPIAAALSLGFAVACLAGCDAGALGARACPARRLLHAVFSGRVLCRRVRRLPDRHRHRAGRRRARRRRQFRRRHLPISPARAAGDLLWRCAALTIWGVEHYRSIAAQQRQISRRLIEEEEYRKLLVDELQHRLKNKLSTVHAVLHQVLHDQPQVWARIDPRIRALSATDDLIARVDGAAATSGISCSPNSDLTAMSASR